MRNHQQTSTMKKLLSIGLFLLSFSLFSQEKESKKLTFSAYLEPYWGYDFTKPDNNARPSFLYSYHRHNEVNLNLAFLKATYQDNKIRGNLAFMAGTYANANLAAENGVLKNIFEANVGVKLSNKTETWLDAGVFGSHIGFESAIGKDCWTLTRSILAENSPYYESGAKITHNSTNQKWLLSTLVLNGWQQINRLDGNQKLAFGTQIQYKPSDKITLNSSTFFGTRPDYTSTKRFFHNFYGIFQLHSKLGLIAGFDYGVEAKSKWYSPVIIAKYSFSDKFSMAARFENYTDKDGVIISTTNFDVNGFSANFDYQITEKLVWRIEGRILRSQTPIFEGNKSNSLIISALALQL